MKKKKIHIVKRVEKLGLFFGIQLYPKNNGIKRRHCSNIFDTVTNQTVLQYTLITNNELSKMGLFTLQIAMQCLHDHVGLFKVIT